MPHPSGTSHSGRSELPSAHTHIPQGEDPPPPALVDTGVAVNGMGVLQGLQISVPDPTDAPEPGDVADLPPQVQHVLAQPAQDLQRQMTAQLQLPPDLGPLYAPQPLSLASNARVIAMLEAHALAAQTSLNRHEIAAYVALGERAIRAIEQIRKSEGSESTPMPAQLLVAGVTLTPNLEVMRAISWYVVACAAQQDVNRQAADIKHQIDGKTITDLTVAGVYVFKDPHYAIYDFMNHYLRVYSRVSTHFNERSDSSLLPYGYTDQRGIEDYPQRLPGEGGTILFDKLKDGQIFFKFEHAGVPTLDSARKVDDQGQVGAGHYTVVQRWVSHSLSFLWTRMYTSPGVKRKEHVYKGLLENEVHRPFLDLVGQAQSLGLLDAQGTADQHAKQAKNQGLPHVEQVLVQLKAELAEAEQPSEQLKLRLSLTDLQGRISDVKRTLGAQSDHLEIERRGAETHVDLNPADLDLQRVQQGFVRPAGIGNVDLPTVDALVGICGVQEEPAAWLRDFAGQMSAAPLLEYLRHRSLGSVGSNVELIGGKETLAITKEAQGVELQWDFAYRKKDGISLQIKRKDELCTMRDDATLEASIRLRFEGLDAFDADKPPVPAVIQLLTCSVQNFELEPQFDQEFGAEVIDPD